MPPLDNAELIASFPDNTSGEIHASNLRDFVNSVPLLVDGGNGTSGFSGYSGSQGSNGATGMSGFSGYSGKSGFSGYSGATGAFTNQSANKIFSGPATGSPAAPTFRTLAAADTPAVLPLTGGTMAGGIYFAGAAGIYLNDGSGTGAESQAIDMDGGSLNFDEACAIVADGTNAGNLDINANALYLNAPINTITMAGGIVIYNSVQFANASYIQEAGTPSTQLQFHSMSGDALFKSHVHLMGTHLLEWDDGISTDPIDTTIGRTNPSEVTIGNGSSGLGNLVANQITATTFVGGGMGTSGFSGYSGSHGATGTSGFSGFSGTNGTVGTSGFSGYSGTNGATGTSGFSGTNGATGTSGFSGYSGKSGFSGYSGTFTNQNANKVYSGPATGSAASPTFRTLVANDTPAALPLAGGTMSGVINMSGQQINMNDGSGTGGGSIEFDGGQLNLDGNSYIQTDGSDGGNITVGGTSLTIDISTTFTDSISGIATFSGQTASSTQTLTDGSSIAWDMNSGDIATVTLAGNRTLANPSNLEVATYILIVKQDATGSRTLAYGTDYKWSGGTAPTLSTAANAVDLITFFCDGTNLYGVMQGDFH